MFKNWRKQVDYFRHQIDANVSRDGGVRRRDFLRTITAASIAAGTLSWRDLVTLQASDLKRRGKAMILLWMQGGPSQFETFSPKPGQATGGETQAISTNVSGIQIAEHFPKVAQSMRDAAIIRSLVSKEGSHPRATFLMHTGYLPTASVKYPTFGSIVAQQLPHEQLELPAFVRIGGGGRDGGNGGFLGVEFDPFLMPAAGRVPTNTSLSTDRARYGRRLDLLARMEDSYAQEQAREEVAEHQKLYQKAARMIQSSQMSAFDLSGESAETREGYGATQFGQGCLLARRLVETGIPCVEVALNGWDTHDDNFSRVKNLAGQVDQPLAFLISDLKQRGLLDDTLVVWMGEFGRTPQINPRGGRDHFPRAFNALLAGGGVRGGQVIGATDPTGNEVTERPVNVSDLFQSFCHSLGINPTFENVAPNGRPIKLVDGGKVVRELFA